MAIEFPCAKCGQQVRTPDAAAGKKGKCPSCGHVQRIPGGETTPTASPPPSKPAQPTPKPPATPAQKTRPTSPPPESPPAPTHLKPAAAKLIKPDPPSLTPSQPTPALNQPAGSKLPEPKLPTSTTSPGKGAAQWTSYVQRGADSVRPSPMPPADPRIAPRQPAEKQVLPRPPAKPQPQSSQPPPAPPSAPPAPPTGKFEFPCPSCGKANRASAETAGKKGRCPHCKALMQIPAAPVAPTPAPVSAKSEPIQKEPPQQEQTPPERKAPPPSAPRPPQPGPQGISSKVNPIGPGKKWETSAEPSASSASDPPLPALTPISDDEPDLPELTPLTPAEIAALAAASPAAPAELTPYAAVPTGYLPPGGTAGYVQPAPLKPLRNPPASHHRRGLPWERDASLGPLMETAATVVFTPATAFRDMWQTGGLAHAIGYAVLVSTAVAVIVGVFSVLFVAAIGGLVAMNARGPAGGFSGPAVRGDVTSAVLHLLGRQVGTNLAIAAFQLTVSALVSSGLTHALLALFGGARGGFETTFRVFLYCMASTALFQFIPCCGVWLAVVWTPIILMIGVTYAHDANGLAGGGAVFLGIGLYYAILFGILSIFFLGFFDAAAGPQLFQ